MIDAHRFAVIAACVKYCPRNKDARTHTFCAMKAYLVAVNYRVQNQRRNGYNSSFHQVFRNICSSSLYSFDMHALPAICRENVQGLSDPKTDGKS